MQTRETSIQSVTIYVAVWKELRRGYGARS